MKRFDTYTHLLFGLLFMMVGSSIDAGTVVARRPMRANQNTRRRRTQLRGRNQLGKDNSAKRGTRNTQKNKDRNKKKWIFPALCVFGIVGAGIYMQQQGGGGGGRDEVVTPGKGAVEGLDDADLQAEAVVYDAVQKTLLKNFYQAKWNEDIFKVKNKPTGDNGIHYQKWEISNFLQSRVSDLMNKRTSPGNSSSTREFPSFIADLYAGDNISYYLPGIDDLRNQEDTAQLLRSVMNTIMRSPEAFGLDKNKITSEETKADKPETEKFEKIQERELRRVFDGTQDCNLHARTTFYAMLGDYTSATDSFKSQVESLIESKKIAILTQLILKHDADIVQLGKETIEWEKAMDKDASAMKQLPHLRAYYIDQWGKDLGISKELISGDRFIKKNSLRLMQNHHWEETGGVRNKVANADDEKGMDKAKFIEKYKRLMRFEILDIADTVILELKKNKSDADDATKINFKSFQKYYFHDLNMSAADKTTDLKKTYDLLMAQEEIKVAVDADGGQNYVMNRNFALFLLEQLELIEGFSKAYMAKIRKKNPSFDIYDKTNSEAIGKKNYNEVETELEAGSYIFA